MCLAITLYLSRNHLSLFFVHFFTVLIYSYFHVTTDFLLGVSDNIISEITPTIAGMLSSLKRFYNNRFANTDAVFSYYSDLFEDCPEMIDLVNKARPKNHLDFMLLELYPYPFACNSLWELRDYSKCAIKSGNVTIPNWCKEDIAEMEKDRRFFRLCYYFPTGKIIIDDVLQNRPKEESPDE